MIDTRTFSWYTRSKRTLESAEVRSIVENSVGLHVFVKKNDAERTGFYSLGRARSSEAMQTTMSGEKGSVVPVVRMLLSFEKPIEAALFDYFHTDLTD
ncbi:DUF3427 domain-containing protein [Mycetocola zhadangensis]|uniref:DUF3427 domain-containing protein n=1 Tax=Mycetocola zhadangensis TaxID=1164595 RepID=A0A3L7J6I2_9MICO|nr:DUF3427 domain-containing protein [Mycetocola zhadangensis]GGE96050.1 hypothetical protein GCM10011313_18760 [Mycetocola zhadangensis]